MGTSTISMVIFHSYFDITGYDPFEAPNLLSLCVQSGLAPEPARNGNFDLFPCEKLMVNHGKLK